MNSKLPEICPADSWKPRLAKIFFTVAVALFFLGFGMLCSCPGWYILAAVLAGVSVFLGAGRLRSWAVACVAASVVMAVLDAFAEARMERRKIEGKRQFEARPSRRTVQTNEVPGILHNNFGEFHPQDSHWTVQVDATTRTASVSHTFAMSAVAGSLAGTTSIAAPRWRAAAGWFAYIDSAECLWLYDGMTNLCIFEKKPNGGTRVWDLITYPDPLPAEVSSRLSKEAQQFMRRK